MPHCWLVVTGLAHFCSEMVSFVRLFWTHSGMEDVTVDVNSRVKFCSYCQVWSGSPAVAHFSTPSESPTAGLVLLFHAVRSAMQRSSTA